MANTDAVINQKRIDRLAGAVDLLEDDIESIKGGDLSRRKITDANKGGSEVEGMSNEEKGTQAILRNTLRIEALDEKVTALSTLVENIHDYLIGTTKTDGLKASIKSISEKAEDNGLFIKKQMETNRILWVGLVVSVMLAVGSLALSVFVFIGG